MKKCEFGTTQKYDRDIYKEALKATAEHRGSTEQIDQKKFAYASKISYEDVLVCWRDWYYERPELS